MKVPYLVAILDANGTDDVGKTTDASMAEII